MGKGSATRVWRLGRVDAKDPKRFLGTKPLNAGKPGPRLGRFKPYRGASTHPKSPGSAVGRLSKGVKSLGLAVARDGAGRFLGNKPLNA